VVAGTLPAAGLDLLRYRFSVEAHGQRPDGVWLRDHAPGAAAIVADPTIPVDGALLEIVGDSLKVVANFGVGYDNIDLDAVRARGVRATNTPGVLTNATAELAVALMARHASSFERMAVVSDEDWTHPALRALSMLLPGKAKAFQIRELGAAKAWLAEGLAG
jgi:glyoxylate reductase